MGPVAPSQHRTSPPDREEGLEFLIFFHRKEVHKSCGLSDTERGRGEEQEKNPSQIFWNSWKSSLELENLLRRGKKKKSLCRSGIQIGFLGNSGGFSRGFFFRGFATGLSREWRLQVWNAENSRAEFQGLGIRDWLFLPGGERGIEISWRKWLKNTELQEFPVHDPTAFPRTPGIPCP